MKTVFEAGKRAGPDLPAIRLHCLEHRLTQIGVLLDEAWVHVVQAEHVVGDQDLPIAPGPGTDADGRDLDGLCDLLGQLPQIADSRP